MTAQNVLDRLDFLEDAVTDGLPPVDTGGTTTGIDTVIATTGEPSIALQNAITAGGTAGASIMLAPGVHLWTTVPTIPPGITGKLRIAGAPGATVRLQSIAPRFLDFGKTADHQTFQNVWLTDLLIDCNSIGGRHHVVLGTYINGTPQTRINLDRINVLRCRTINVPTDNTVTNHRLNVWMVVAHPADNEATQSTITNIQVESCDFTGGGNQGIVVGGAGPDSGPGLNVWWDEVHFWGNKCDPGVTPTTKCSSSNFQIGSSAFGGRGSIVNCKGRNSADVGVETNACQHMTIRSVEIEDALAASFYHTNYTNPIRPQEQRLHYDDCHSRRLLVGAPNTGVQRSFAHHKNNSVDLGHILLRNCSHYHGIAHAAETGQAIYTQTCKSFTVDGFKGINENLDFTDAGGVTYSFIEFATNQTGGSPVSLRNAFISLSGQKSGAGSVTYIPILVSSGTLWLDIEDVTMTTNITSMTSTGIHYIDLGQTATALKSGSIRRVRVTATTGDTASRGIIVRGTAILTISGKLDIEYCDLTGTVVDVLFATPPQNQDKTFFRGNKWRVFPRPSAAMISTGTNANFTADTFTSGAGLQYVGNSPAQVHFQTGTGTNVTLIAASKDGVTYEQVYAQASGALAQDVLVPVDNGDYIKVTFVSGTQPTTRVRYAK